MLAAKSVPSLAPFERGEKTRAEMAAELGISLQWLRKLMARDRERAADGVKSIDDLPYVELATGDLPEGRPAYLLDSSVPFRDPGKDDICNVQSGKIRISKRRRLVVRSVNGGAPIEQTGKKKYTPDPDGLEGGRDRPKPKKRRKRAMIDTK